MTAIRLDTIESAISAIARGEAVVVVDDEARENEGDLIFAAAKSTPALTGFMIRHTSGYVCVALTGDDLDRLNLPPMTRVNEDRRGTAYAVTVDARDVAATGISAADRARTIKVLSDSATEPRDLSDRDTSCRCGPSTAACCAGPGIPRPRSTWRGWPG